MNGRLFYASGIQLEICSRLLLLAFPLVLVSGLIVFDRPLWRHFASVVIWLILACCLYIYWSDLRKLGWTFLIPLISIFWFTCSVFWTNGLDVPAARSYLFAGMSTATFFIVATLYVRSAERSNIRFLGIALIIATSINICLALYIHVHDLGLSLIGCENIIVDASSTYCRLQTHAILISQNLGALIVAQISIVAARLICSTESFAHKVLLSSFLLLAATYILLVGSRSVLLATGISLSFLFVMLSPKAITRQVALAAIPLSVFGAALLLWLPSSSDTIVDFISRPHYRAEVWRDALQFLMDRPWIGHGIADDTLFAGFAVHPHNLFFSALYYSGLPGLALSAATLVVAFWLSARIQSLPDRYMLIALLLALFTVSLFDTSVPLGRNHRMDTWYYFWMPLALVWGLSFKRTATTRKPTPVVTRTRK